MGQDENEEKINHVKKNLSFFVKYWDELSQMPKSKQVMLDTVDYLLDKLIDLLKLRK